MCYNDAEMMTMAELADQVERFASLCREVDRSLRFGDALRQIRALTRGDVSGYDPDNLLDRIHEIAEEALE